jgi:hypothetical protein
MLKLHDFAVPLYSTYSKELEAGTQATCTLILAALFTIAKR